MPRLHVPPWALRLNRPGGRFKVVKARSACFCELYLSGPSPCPIRRWVRPRRRVNRRSEPFWFATTVGRHSGRLLTPRTGWTRSTSSVSGPARYLSPDQPIHRPNAAARCAPAPVRLKSSAGCAGCAVGAIHLWAPARRRSLSIGVVGSTHSTRTRLTSATADRLPYNQRCSCGLVAQRSRATDS